LGSRIAAATTDYNVLAFKALSIPRQQYRCLRESMTPMSEENKIEPDHELTTAEILGWLEFACWTALMLAPVLYYVNGPSVSTDQFVVRTVSTVLSACGAAIFRFLNWRRCRREKCKDR